ncbi:TonB-dependent receptor [Mucilaginibacter daejeonensis]|uniref:outer membrane beta-barrel family protein n=1 Tax=Mucilaginibacter daejeonensis TaxID=398049 RepID=UPI001D17231A|nr:outer membrane beta-barrel family protein [Mucilaginibacter daejeonensis]UEG55175.1 TonB-dependent receptor [Mucilaginibacter daejeonensis]
MRPSLLLILIFITNIVFAQGKITGKIVDATTNAPVDYATVGLFAQGSKQPVSGITSDDKGNFTLTNINNGEYHITVNFIGYKEYGADHVIISDDQKAVTLGTIKLIPASKQLNEVTVTAKAPVIENMIDKMVYNTANDLTSQGGVALDVLKKVPQVSVDIDGNVELQGNTSVRFLINGKPSTMFGSSLNDVLASLPASQIKSIEVITSPGAKYDAQGLGGIINIILKNDKLRGISGSVTASAGTRLQNGSETVSVRRNNFGVSAFLSGNAQINTRTMNLNDRTSTDASGRSTRLIQNGYSDVRRKSYNSGINVDWSPSKANSFTASLTVDQFGNRNQGMTAQQQTATGLADVLSQRTSLSDLSNHNIDWSLDHKHKFKREGQELEILYTYSQGKNNSSYDQQQIYNGQLLPFSASASTNPGTNHETNISADYTQPIAKDVLLETGAKTILQNINSVTNVNSYDAKTGAYSYDPGQSYKLKYDRKIYAGYVSLGASPFKQIDVKAGLRIEHTNTHIGFPGTTIPSYTTAVPTAVISHKFSDVSSLKVSYTKRIERAEYRELNPFVNLSDPYNIITGNPLLRPEIGNVFELGYNRSFRSSGSLYIALFSRHNSNDVKTYTNFYSQYRVGDSVYRNVSVTNRQNIGTEQNTGLNISGSVYLSKKLNIRTNTSIIDKYIVNKVYGGPSVNALIVRGNMNVSYQFTNDLIGEAFANYNSPMKNIQGRTPKFVTYNLAFRKQLMNKMASIGFTTTNPFAKYVDQLTTIDHAATSNGAPYTSYSLRRVPYRSFGISFAYRFGKLDAKASKIEEPQVKPIEN